MKLNGSCHCQAVRFTVESASPYPFMRCYCSICRKTAGAGGYAINLGADRRTLVGEGAEHLSVYRASLEDGSESSGERNFCRRCGSALWLYDPNWPDLGLFTLRSTPRRGLASRQTRRRRRAWRCHARSRQRSVAARQAPARRVSPKKARTRRCKCSPWPRHGCALRLDCVLFSGSRGVDRRVNRPKHPHASVIDTPLPVPPERVHIMLGSKAPWVEPEVRPGDRSFDRYPDESLAQWHARHGL